MPFLGALLVKPDRVRVCRKTKAADIYPLGKR